MSLYWSGMYVRCERRIGTGVNDVVGQSKVDYDAVLGCSTRSRCSIRTVICTKRILTSYIDTYPEFTPSAAPDTALTSGDLANRSGQLICLTERKDLFNS